MPTAIFEQSVLDFYTLLPSLDGKKLFFIGQTEHRELARYDSRDRQLIPYLQHLPPNLTGPMAFSEDGRWVAYVSSGRLYRSKLDGSEKAEVNSLPAGFGYPSASFSPDGQKMAFELSRFAEGSKIFITSSGGGDAELVTSGESRDTEPQWSPNGNTILFVRAFDKPGHGEPQNYACLFDLKTRQFSKLPGSDGGQAFRWSPDGRYISADLSSGVSLFDLGSRQWRELGKFATFNHASWSKDGKYLYGQLVAGQVTQPNARIRVSAGKVE